MYDPELLRLIHAGTAELSSHLHFIEPERLQAHVARLFCGGELEVLALTAWGARRLHEPEGVSARSREA